MTENFLATGGGGGGRQKKLSPEKFFLQSVPLTFWDGLTPLNPAKCKEMLINFMQDPNFLLKPINLANRTVQQVSCFKLLGVYLSDDLKWNAHIDYIYTKACKRLYALRILVRVGVKKRSIIKVYVTMIRPIFGICRSCLAIDPRTSMSENRIYSEKSLKDNFSGSWFVQ